MPTNSFPCLMNVLVQTPQPRCCFVHLHNLLCLLCLPYPAALPSTCIPSGPGCDPPSHAAQRTSSQPIHSSSRGPIPAPASAAAHTGACEQPSLAAVPPAHAKQQQKQQSMRTGGRMLWSEGDLLLGGGRGPLSASWAAPGASAGEQGAATCREGMLCIHMHHVCCATWQQQSMAAVGNAPVVDSMTVSGGLVLASTMFCLMKDVVLTNCHLLHTHHQVLPLPWLEDGLLLPAASTHQQQQLAVVAPAAIPTVALSVPHSCWVTGHRPYSAPSWHPLQQLGVELGTDTPPAATAVAPAACLGRGLLAAAVRKARAMHALRTNNRAQHIQGAQPAP